MIKHLDLRSPLADLKQEKGWFDLIIDEVGIYCFNNAPGGYPQNFRMKALEILAKMYLQEKEKCFEKITDRHTGIIICDFKKDKLYILTDKIGQATLYYSLKRGIFLLSAHLEPIAHNINAEIDQKAFFNFLNLDFIPAPLSIYKGIRKIPPSSYLLTEKGGLCLKQYRNFTSLKINQDPEKLKTELKQAILDELSLYRNGKIGLLLSAGLDSSLLAKFATQLYGPIYTFTLSCLPYNSKTVFKSREVSSLFKSIHSEVIFSVKDYVKNFPLCASLLREPVFNRNLPTIRDILSRLPSDVKYLLYGYGGDEIFGERLAKKKKPTNLRNTVLSYLMTKAPREIQAHTDIAYDLRKIIALPYLSYRVSSLGVNMPEKLRYNKLLLKTIDLQILKLRPVTNSENSYHYLTIAKTALEHYYDRTIRNSTILKQLYGKDKLATLRPGENDQIFLKLALFHFWANKTKT